MKKQLLLALACLLGLSVTASTMDTIRPPRPKVGVVLGGGGAKGATHIGALKYIEEMGIPIDYIAGTSMGSIIGGMYAMGYSPDELTEIIGHMDWSAYVGNSNDRTLMSSEVRKRNSTNLLNVPFGKGDAMKRHKKQSLINTLPSAYVNNASLINLFNNLCIGYQESIDFNDLPIPFACVATDVATGEEVVIRSGSVPEAMRASMAIPGVFSPVTIGDHVLVDGGMVNNFPADVLREMGADIIIGVEVTKEQQVTPDDLQSLPQLLGKLFLNIVNAKREQNRKLCDIHIVPDITGFGMLSFTPDAIDTLVNRGYKRANDFHDQFVVIKNYIDKCAGHPVEKELHAQPAKNLKTDPVFIRSITMSKTSATQSKWHIRKGDLEVGKFMVADDIEKAVNIYRGTGAFDGITYNITKDQTEAVTKDVADETYDLSIDFEPAKPHVIGLGLRYDTEDGAALLFTLGLNEKKLSGFKTNMSIRLSYNPKFNLTFTYSGLAIGSANLSYDFHNYTFRYLVNTKHTSVGIQNHALSAYFSQFHLLNFDMALGASYAYNILDDMGQESIEDTSYFDNKIFAPYINLTYDNMDDAYFAKRGVEIKLNGRVNFDVSSHITPNKANKPCEEVSCSFKGHITPNNGRFTIIPQVYSRFIFGNVAYVTQYNFIGGDTPGRYFNHQMPFIGIHGIADTYDLATILRCDLRYNFYGKHYITAMYNYYQSTEQDKHTNEWYRENYHGAGLKYSYDSPIGPISLTGQWSNYYNLYGESEDGQKAGNFSLYFSLGYTF